MRRLWIVAALPVLALGCREGANKETPVAETNPPPPPPQQPPPAQPGAAQPMDQAQPVTGAQPARGQLLSCQPGTEIEQTASRLVELADTNGDGKVSKDEAQSLTNFVVGGFFFRADTNGDGTVTPDEGRRARSDFMQQNPEVAALFRGVRSATGKSPFATLAQIVDVDYGKPLTLTEARGAARNAVNDLYSVADADHDGVITMAEARNAAWQGTRLLGNEAFQAADTDHDGKLTPAELQDALRPAADAAFKMADTNDDGKLSEDEAAVAMHQIGRLVGVRLTPQPAGTTPASPNQPGQPGQANPNQAAPNQPGQPNRATPDQPNRATPGQPGRR